MKEYPCDNGAEQAYVYFVHVYFVHVWAWTE
jgi:imidazoleglycerol phosphate synthase glutamine amidotransferase subunit HisH